MADWPEYPPGIVTLPHEGPTSEERFVFVPNHNPAHDYSGLDTFGSVVFCTYGQMPKGDLPTMQMALSDTMQNAGPEDLILITSLASLCAIACCMQVSRFGKVNVLLHEAGQYHEHTLDFDN